MSQSISQILIIDEIFMGYLVAGKLRTMRNIFMYKSKLSIGYMTLSRVLVIPCEVLLRGHFINTSIIALIVSGMYLGFHFDSCGSFCDPVPGLIVYLVIWVELVQKGFGITLVLDGQNYILEVLS